MNVLLDTCALICLTAGSLSRSANQALATASSAFVSPISAWEVALKHKLGELHLKQSPLDWNHSVCARYHLTELPLQADLLCAAADLPLIHRNPFDRVLIATAMSPHPASILTADQIIPIYPNVVVVW